MPAVPRFVIAARGAIQAKKSQLCVGLDPSPELAVKDADTPSTEHLQYCLEVVEQTSDFAAAFKPNLAYMFPLSLSQFQTLNRAIREAGCVSILDWKLGDIGSTNAAALHWASRAGFDAVTFNPFAGNIAEATQTAHAQHISLIVLCLMSNPEARFFMRDAFIAGVPGYEWIASQVGQHQSGGVVVGATHTTALEARKIRKLAGNDSVFLVPGVGAQGGEAGHVLKESGELTLVNVGRAILNSKTRASDAQKYRDAFNAGRQ